MVNSCCLQVGPMGELHIDLLLIGNVLQGMCHIHVGFTVIGITLNAIVDSYKWKAKYMYEITLFLIKLSSKSFIT